MPCFSQRRGFHWHHLFDPTWHRIDWKTEARRCLRCGSWRFRPWEGGDG